jgi:small-conductance mechanosensitive channel
VERLDDTANPAPWFRHPLLLTLLGLVLGALVMRSLAKWMQLRWLRARKTVIEPWPLGEIAALAAIDLAAWCLYWLVCRHVSGALFSDRNIVSTVGAWLLWQGPRFLLYLTATRILFRPSLKQARIAPLDDKDARLAAQFFIVIAAVMSSRTWVLILSADSVTEPTLAAALLLNNLLFVTTTFCAAFRSRDAIARWIRNDGTERGVVTPFRNFAADHWILFLGVVAVLLSLGHLYGTLSGRAEVGQGLSLTLRTLLLLIFAASAVQFVARRLETPLATEAGSTTAPRLSTPLARVIRLVISLGTLYWLAWLWLVDSLGIISSDSWENANARLLQPALVVVFGLIAWTGIKFATDRYLAFHSGSSGGASARTSSRLKTLVPLIRLAFGMALFILVALVALSDLGVNITPLLAGASVIGLAISFGSQALVKDIVSGFFFLADDAFRVGEYINCGKVKGTVEGFTLRSVRLRHQSGQVHTVPFGQLGEITNFSRDWTSVKFTINLDRGVDLDHVRRITKEVGKALQEDPHLSTLLLEPLKFQGIANITDSAIIADFKFVARPTGPSEVEREAKRQLLYRFREEGIKLASQPLASSIPQV